MHVYVLVNHVPQAFRHALFTFETNEYVLLLSRMKEVQQDSSLYDFTSLVALFVCEDDHVPAVVRLQRCFVP